MKKIISLICFISILTLSTAAYAEQNIKVTNKFFDDWLKHKFTMGDLIDLSTSNLDFKNDELRIHARPIFSIHLDPVVCGSNNTVNKKYDNVVYTSPKALELNVPTLTSCGILLDITNNTDDIISIDLNKSVISVGSYYGKPLISSVKFSEQITATLPPLIIPPHGTVKSELYRADYSLDELGGKRITKWQCPADFHPNENIFGNGYQALAVGISDLKYVTFTLNANIPSSAFDPYLKKK